MSFDTKSKNTHFTNSLRKWDTKQVISLLRKNLFFEDSNYFPEKQAVYMSDIHQILQSLQKSSSFAQETDYLKVFIDLRKLILSLSDKNRKTMVKKFVELKFCDALIRFMRMFFDQTPILIELSWIMIIIFGAVGKENCLEIVMSDEFIPLYQKMIFTVDAELLENTIWGFANMCRDSQEIKTILKNQQIVFQICQKISSIESSNFWPKEDLLKIVSSFALFCSYYFDNAPKLQFQEIEIFLDYFFDRSFNVFQSLWVESFGEEFLTLILIALRKTKSDRMINFFDKHKFFQSFLQILLANSLNEELKKNYPETWKNGLNVLTAIFVNLSKEVAVKSLQLNIFDFAGILIEKDKMEAQSGVIILTKVFENVHLDQNLSVKDSLFCSIFTLFLRFDEDSVLLDFAIDLIGVLLDHNSFSFKGFCLRNVECVDHLYPILESKVPETIIFKFLSVLKEFYLIDLPGFIAEDGKNIFVRRMLENEHLFTYSLNTENHDDCKIRQMYREIYDECIA